MATLYVVATPIGNLEDTTFRALRVFKETDVIACEDVRVTKRLLDHFGVSGKQIVTYNEKKSGVGAQKIIRWLGEGRNVALVSDAGTPVISDPGTRLVSGAKKVLGSELKVVPVPGPSALIAALSASGVPASEFTFLGFLPHKKGRETLFKEIGTAKRTVVFYESPHRIMKTLESLAECAPDRKVVVARELTKIYEDFQEGLPPEVVQYFNNNRDKIRGEFVVIVSSIRFN